MAFAITGEQSRGACAIGNDGFGYCKEVAEGQTQMHVLCAHSVAHHHCHHCARHHQALEEVTEGQCQPLIVVMML